MTSTGPWQETESQLQAIYQAELTVCAANRRAIVTGATTYAAQSNRSYPDRPAVRDDVVWPTAQIYYLQCHRCTSGT